MKQRILSTVRMLINDFLYEDRDDDILVPLGTIEQSIVDGVITTEEIAEEFKRSLEEQLTGTRA